ncbi:creatininase family protein [Salinimicrobium sp. MT39]|uniref:Creatininase family protein n=1 Tax=Salinimicrobium profundisediminis TaxID=2994553 RepID=A0A9X3CXV9_9FLAO|nr:creatininase family protein [Salinimicrobium profundisediminis]MCX2838548.1 creatininase family protein [Salinimicrobium profundisediminis]
MRPYILAESNWKTVKEQKTEVAVLTWGATEAHNFHLPYATDNYQIEAIAAEAAKKAWEAGGKVLVLPNIPFGVNTGQTEVDLCMNLYPSTQLAILNDLVEVLDRSGVKKLLLLNGHGGNNFKALLREVGAKYPKMLLVTTSFFQTVDRKEFFEEAGDHADEMETSLMLHLRPELVLPLEEAGNGEEKHSRLTAIKEGWAWSERKWHMVSADTGIGDPRKASEEKGKRFFDAVTRQVADLLLEMDKIKNEDRYEE